MDLGLVVGTAAAGVVVGLVVDDVAARVPPPSQPAPGSVAATGPPAVAERVAAAALGAVLLGAAADHFGPVPALAAYCVLFAGLLAVTVTDVRVGLVPRRFVLVVGALLTAGLVGAAAAGGHWHALGDAAIGGAGAFLVLYAVWWLFPRGMGFGDVRLSALVGAGLGWLGLRHVYVGFVVAFVAGTVLGVVLMLVRGTGRRTRLPFAPALALGAVVGILWGGQMIDAWLR